MTKLRSLLGRREPKGYRFIVKITTKKELAPEDISVCLAMGPGPDGGFLLDATEDEIDVRLSSPFGSAW